MLAAVQEHVQSAACVLYQVSESLHVDTRVIKTWNITPSPSVSFVCVINDKMTKASNKNEYAEKKKVETLLTITQLTPSHF